jgi:hypothetical protein
MGAEGGAVGAEGAEGAEGGGSQLTSRGHGPTHIYG